MSFIALELAFFLVAGVLFHEFLRRRAQELEKWKGAAIDAIVETVCRRVCVVVNNSVPKEWIEEIVKDELRKVVLSEISKDG